MLAKLFGIERALGRWTDIGLTVLLLSLAVLIVGSAFLAPRLMKAAIAAWVIFP